MTTGRIIMADVTDVEEIPAIDDLVTHLTSFRPVTFLIDGNVVGDLDDITENALWTARAENAALQSSLAESEHLRLEWQQRAEHMTSLYEQEAEKVRMLKGEPPVNGPLVEFWKPEHDQEYMQITKGGYYRLHSLATVAEDERDRMNSVLAETMRMLDPWENPHFVERRPELVQEVKDRVTEAERLAHQSDQKAKFLEQILKDEETRTANAVMALDDLRAERDRPVVIDVDPVKEESRKATGFWGWLKRRAT